MPSNRAFTLGGLLWALGATDPPDTPVDGSTYGNSAITQTIFTAGQPFNTVMNSATLNEVLRRLTQLVNSVEYWGIIPWSSLTDYAPFARVLGSDGLIYRAVSINGPGTTPGAVDPTTDNGTNWIPDFIGLLYALDIGTVNAFAANYNPVVTSLKDGEVLGFKALHTNTGASTFSPNSLTGKPIYGAAQLDLQGGEILAHSDVWVQYNSSLNNGSGAWMIISSSGGALQVAIATQSFHALNKGFLSLTGAPGRVPVGNSYGELDPSWVVFLGQRLPEILTPSKILTVIGSSGEVSLTSGQQFVIRDGFQVTVPSGVNFATGANKTFHLRYVFETGANASNMGNAFYEEKGILDQSFYLADLSDPAYNSLYYTENNPVFDSQLDDMLIAKIVTDGGNNPTVTALINTNNLCAYDNQRNYTQWPFPLAETIIPGFVTFTNNYARSFKANVGGNFYINLLANTGAQCAVRIRQNGAIAGECLWNFDVSDGNKGSNISVNRVRTINRGDSIVPYGIVTSDGANCMALDLIGMIDAYASTLQSEGSSFYVSGIAWT